MRIIILGGGAIGSVFGGFLAKDGHGVVFLGRGEHFRNIKESGLRISGIWGDHRVNNFKAYNTVSEIKKNELKPFDLALLTVKAYDSEEILTEYRRYFDSIPPVVSLQNGLGNLELLTHFAGKDKAIGGRVIFGAEIVKPGHVKVTVYAEEVMLGGNPGGISQEKVEEIANIINKSGIPTLATDEIEKYIWAKSLYNCALNPLGSILEVNYGKLLADEATRRIMSAVIKEIFWVIRKKDIRLFWENDVEFQKILFNRLIPATSSHFPSMLQDIKKGKKTEIDFLNGKVVLMGQESGIDLPVNNTLFHLIKSKERLYAKGSG
ncbi:MAG: 2-dehydropantoate 2-reductase [Thermodesulfobacteriota bacterium]|nr:2-dehydropantoate 2-reductase [Thermodesulfobacteriota bacterium]